MISEYLAQCRPGANLIAAGIELQEAPAVFEPPLPSTELDVEPVAYDAPAVL